jgi:hypothetical protein
MQLVATLGTALALGLGSPTPAPAPPSVKHYRRVMVVHRYRHYVRTLAYNSTYYSYGCDPTGGGSMTANETPVHFGEVANSILPFGTKIHLEPAVLGQHDFVVEDRFGSQLDETRIDIWLPCGTTIPNPSGTMRIYTERVVVFYKRVLVNKCKSRKVKCTHTTSNTQEAT